MNITVRLFAGLKCGNKELEYFGLDDFNIELPTRMNLEELLSFLGIPAEMAKIVLVNGLFQPLTYILSEGDELSVFPPVGGG